MSDISEDSNPSVEIEEQSQDPVEESSQPVPEIKSRPARAATHSVPLSKRLACKLHAYYLLVLCMAITLCV